MKNDRKERCVTREKNKRVKNAKKSRVENVETTKVDSSDIVLSVPFDIATKLNQNMGLRRVQNNLRMQLHTIIENNITTLDKDLKSLEGKPEIRARLIVEMMRMVLPRPKDFGDETDSKEYRDKLISRLFGKRD